MWKCYITGFPSSKKCATCKDNSVYRTSLIENCGDKPRTLNKAEQRTRDKRSNTAGGGKAQAVDSVLEAERDRAVERSAAKERPRTHDNESNQSDTLGSKPLLACGVCQRAFKQKHHLIRHERIHTGNKTYECSICQVKFLHKHQLTDHLKIHTGEKLHPCNICLKKFSNNKSLTVHMRTQSGEKPYVCSVCNKKFPQRGNLSRHITALHCGQKAFSCGVCFKKFTEKNDLNRHTRVHTGEKPYSCKYCHHNFSLKHHLTRHLKLHTGERE